MVVIKTSLLHTTHPELQCSGEFHVAEKVAICNKAHSISMVLSVFCNDQIIKTNNPPPKKQNTYAIANIV